MPLPPPARPAGRGRGAGRRVYVVGGGPGGLQAAVTAAQRGHRVTLFEAAAGTGGQAAVAARMPGRAGFGALPRDLDAQARRAGVRLETGHRVHAEFLRASGPTRSSWPPAPSRSSRPGRTVTPGWWTWARWPAARPGRKAPWSCWTSSASTRPRRWRNCSRTAAARWKSSPAPWSWARTSGSPWTWSCGPGRRTLRAYASGRTWWYWTPGERGGLAGAHAAAPPDRERQRLACDWVACAVPPRPADELWHALRGAGPGRPGAVRGAPGGRLPGPAPGARRGDRGRAGRGGA